jgi:hypothetical protein
MLDGIFVGICQIEKPNTIAAQGIEPDIRFHHGRQIAWPLPST